MVDERQRMGDFILTGSAQFDLMAGITQSLAGRVGRVELLPLSGAELGPKLLPQSLDTLLLKGGYPTLYDTTGNRTLVPNDWFPNYVATYLERDVRQLLAVHDLSQFHRFVRMCAARSGQIAAFLPSTQASGCRCWKPATWSCVCHPTTATLANDWSRPPNCIFWMSA